MKNKGIMTWKSINKRPIKTAQFARRIQGDICDMVRPYQSALYFNCRTNLY